MGVKRKKSQLQRDIINQSVLRKSYQIGKMVQIIRK